MPRPQLGDPRHCAYLVDDIAATVDRLVEQLGAGPFFLRALGRLRTAAHGPDLYRLCFMRGPEGILIGLAEEIGWRGRA